MKRAIYGALLIALLPQQLLSADNYPRVPAIDAVHYRIDLKLQDDSDELVAETQIQFDVRAAGVKEVVLDFVHLIIDAVTENERQTTFTQANDRLIIALDEDIRPGDRCRISVKYHGHPKDGLFMKKNKFGDRVIFADNWPNRAHHWFPAIDHPYDKATVEFIVTAPDRYDVVANGTLLETSSNQDGTKRTHWTETSPIPTYCMVIGVAQFSVLHVGTWDRTPLAYYLFPRDRDVGVQDYGRALQMIEFYTNLIGPYPYEKLALVESTTQFGGMENSSSIFFDEKSFDGSGKLEDIVAHEIAHQWFGDAVTEADWDHLWLSEGFATYFSHLFFEHADGRDTFRRLMQADKERYFAAHATDPRPIRDPTIRDLFQLLNRNNYEKGGWVLHMLRHVMGDQAFFEGVRDYYRSFRNQNALTSDFEKVMEFHASRPLDWFFKEWIDEPGYPIFRVTWHWDEVSKQLRVQATQEQDSTVFRMPLDVEIRLADSSRREVIEIKERDQAFTFPLDSRPTRLMIDPDEWVLKQLRISER